MKIEVDFRKDYADWCRNELTFIGVKKAASLDTESVSLAYWNSRFRWIAPRPRRVHLSVGFAGANSQEVTSAIQALRTRFTVGEDLRPFQSTSLESPKHQAFHDRLFNDWGIHHFHLGELLPGRRFAARTGPLLFAVVRPDDAYFVDVLPHGSWAEKRLLETVHLNWRNLLPAHLPGIVSAEEVSDEDRAQLRNAGVISPITMTDGTVYLAVNGGYSTTGLSSRVLSQSDRSFEELAELQDWLIKNAEAELRAKGVALPATLRPRLLIGDELIAFDEDAKIAFKLGPSGRLGL